MSYTIPDSVIFIDLETLPADASVGMDLTQAPGWTPPPLVMEEPERRTVPSSWKDPGKIQTWYAKEQIRYTAALGEAKTKAYQVQRDDRIKALEHWKRASVDGYRARIACVSYAIGERPVQVIDCVEDEAGGLRELAMMTGPRSTWVAHNGEGFDFPMIQLRAIKHGGLRLAGRFHQSKPWDGTLVDTLKWWPTLGGWGDRFKGTKLDAICEHLGIERTDNPIDGSQVLAAYVEGRWEDVIAHAAADVRDLREVYRVLAEVRGV